LPNVGPYIYDVSISGFTRSSIYIYDISSLRVKPRTAEIFLSILHKHTTNSVKNKRLLLSYLIDLSIYMRTTSRNYIIFIIILIFFIDID